MSIVGVAKAAIVSHVMPVNCHASTLDHLEIVVSNAKRSRDFYAAALDPLGVKYMYEIKTDTTRPGEKRYGFGREGKPYFWVKNGSSVGSGTHVAFTAPTREAVDAFYAAAIKAGGTNNGAPGVRDRYHSHYYAAFVLDPDGVNVEAVCHEAA